MDPVLSSLNTAITVINNVQTFEQSAKQAKKYWEELQKEATSTTEKLTALQNIIKSIGSGLSIASVTSQSSETQHLLQLDHEFKEKMQNLQQAVDGARTQLEPVDEEKPLPVRKKFLRVSRAEKEVEKAKALLKDLRSIQEDASWLTQIITV